MMASDGEIKPATPTQSIHNSDDCVINRKREHRGLPRSFSSNLGQPRISPRSHQEREGTPRSNAGSVKAIVAWLEASKSTNTDSPSAVSGDAESMRSKLSIATSSPSLATESSQLSLPTSPDVEEYSLTLLKYRQYFTETPLGRCLDSPSTTNSQTVVVGFADDSSQKLSPSDTSPSDKQLTPRNAQTQPLSQDRRQNGSERARRELKNRRAHHSSQNNRSGHNEQLVRRDPREVEAFWKQVRSYLWIPEEELEDMDGSNIPSETTTHPVDVCTTKLASPGQTNSLDEANTSKSQLSPHRKVHSETVISSRKRIPYPRRRFLSTEEKMSEIDAFLDEDSGQSSELVSDNSGTPVSTRTTTRSPPGPEAIIPPNTESFKYQGHRGAPIQDNHSLSGKQPATQPPQSPKSPTTPTKKGVCSVIPPVFDYRDEGWNFF